MWLWRGRSGTEGSDEDYEDEEDINTGGGVEVMDGGEIESSEEREEKEIVTAESRVVELWEDKRADLGWLVAVVKGECCVKSAVRREHAYLCELMGLGVKDGAGIWVVSGVALLGFERGR